MNKPKTPYPYNDKVIAEQVFTNDINFRVLKNEKGTFIDVRKYFYGRPSQKGVRIPLDDFEAMLRLFKDSLDEMRLDEEKEGVKETVTSQVLSKPIDKVIEPNKKVKK